MVEKQWKWRQEACLASSWWIGLGDKLARESESQRYLLSLRTELRIAVFSEKENKREAGCFPCCKVYMWACLGGGVAPRISPY